MSISKQEALSVLKINLADEAEEAYESLVFEWKQKYLSLIPPVSLIKAHIKKIERLNEAACHFLSLDSNQDLHVETIDAKISLKNYLMAYQPIVMQIKLLISSATNGMILIQTLKRLIELEMSIAVKLGSYCPPVDDEILSHVKLSGSGWYYEAQKELIEKEIPEKEIKNYLRNELENGQYPFSSALLNSVLRAVKQIK